jgi:hypothetical protein
MGWTFDKYERWLGDFHEAHPDAVVRLARQHPRPVRARDGTA